jgi:hypothetical protein
MGPYSTKLYITLKFFGVKSVNFEKEDQERLTSCQQAGTLAAANSCHSSTHLQTASFPNVMEGLKNK